MNKLLTGDAGMPVIIRGVVQAPAKLRGTTAEATIQPVQANLIRVIQDDP